MSGKQSVKHIEAWILRYIRTCFYFFTYYKCVPNTTSHGKIVQYPERIVTQQQILEINLRLLSLLITHALYIFPKHAVNSLFLKQ